MQTNNGVRQGTHHIVQNSTKEETKLSGVCEVKTDNSDQYSLALRYEKGE